MTDIFARNRMFFGSKGLERLEAAHVAVVGLGGVGAYAAEALVRAGVGRLRVIVRCSPSLGQKIGLFKVDHCRPFLFKS